MNEYAEIISRWYKQLHQPFVSLIKSRFTGLSDSEIEDLYQETFVAVYDNLQGGRVSDDTNWKAYIYRIGLNQANNLCKKNAGVVAIDRRELKDDDVPSSRYENLLPLGEMIDDEDEVSDRENRINVVNSALDKLRERCRTLLRDFYINKLSLAEIRDEMGYANTDSVKTQRYKCFSRLKTALMAQMDKIM